MKVKANFLQLPSPNHLVNILQDTSNEINDNPIVQWLASQNQNIVAQIIISLSQEFNRRSTESIAKVTSSGIPAATISISSLGSARLPQRGPVVNQSAWVDFNRDTNSQANVREYLISFSTDLPISTSNSIKLQSSALAQLTKATNQLTRTTLTIASGRCYRLAIALYSMSTRIAYEDVQIAATQLMQCASNLLSVGEAFETS